MNAMVRVVVCDDDAVVRAGLLALLFSSPDIDVVAEAGSGADAVALTARLGPDVVLMDPRLGADIDGVEATRRITTAPSNTAHVLILTTSASDTAIAHALDAGATGYLLTTESPEEFFAAIRAAAVGRPTLSEPVARRVMARIRHPNSILTPRELDILHQLAQGLGNREIARTLFISEVTVKTHLGRIYDKLGVDSRAAAVAVATEQRLLG